LEKNDLMSFEDLGGRVASVWEGLRPATRSIVERALAAAQSSGAAAGSSGYDARSEWELSRLLAALDDHARGSDAPRLSAEQERDVVRMADACASALHSGARTAEAFAQLLERALRARDYGRVDELADTLAARVAPSELCELARNLNQALRALATEALAQKPTRALVDLLGDPVDAATAREALEIQADEYDVEEARWVVNTLERIEEDEEG
jgi:hypothetical protein